MSIIDNPRLQKLTVKAYAKPEREDSLLKSMEVMYNPTSFSQKYEARYAKTQGIGSSDTEKKYIQSLPREVKLKLVVDGTGVSSLGLDRFLGDPPTVSERVREFVELAFHQQGEQHEPSYLRVEWGGQEDGGLQFSCRLKSVNVTYTSFNRDGSPLRAELDVVLISDEEAKKRLAKENSSSPDLTHTRIVRAGDTLTLLCREIYGDPSYYLRIAQVNQLDHFRSLVPGQELVFPPLKRG